MNENRETKLHKRKSTDEWKRGEGKNENLRGKKINISKTRQKKVNGKKER